MANTSNGMKTVRTTSSQRLNQWPTPIYLEMAFEIRYTDTVLEVNETTMGFDVTQFDDIVSGFLIFQMKSHHE